MKRFLADRVVITTALKHAVQSVLGKDCDWLFEWADSLLYCSEPVWKAYRRSHGIEIERLRSLRDFDMSSPSMQERYGKMIQTEMSVIAPSDLLHLPLLLEVSKR